MERTRLAQLFLEGWSLLRPDTRILHFAPEQALAGSILKRPDIEYRPVDLDPSGFRFMDVEEFDICHDAPQLPRDTYSVIINMHVMEHIPCNVTVALYHIHRSLAPDGVHLLSIPISGGHFAEDLGPMEPAQATARFGQSDHVRRFGLDDLSQTVGAIFELADTYDMRNFFSEDELAHVNIPESEWSGYTGHSVIPLRTEHFKLTEP